MRLSIVHETKYRYATPANYTIQYLRLSPQPTPQQKVIDWHLDLPVPARPFLDGFGNTAHVLVIDRPHQEIRIRARGEVEVSDESVISPDPGLHHPELFMRSTELTAQDESIIRFSNGFRRQVANDRAAAIEALMIAVREKVEYKKGVTEVTTTAAKAFARGAGVCQDHAHVFVACCRHLEIPARHVSGYLAPKELTSANGTPRELASHAWAEAWIDGVGWQGFDVANQVRSHGRHVRVAVGLDYLDACPVRGFHRGGSGESLGVEVRVNDPSASATEQQQQQQQQ